MKLTPAQKQTRVLVQTAAEACEDKKGLHTRILELDPSDSGLSDFFLVTSASNDRQAVAIADEIELRLKRQFGIYPRSVEGRRNGEWILLDYVDFVVHVFLAERRAFYDIERLRKSARPLTPTEFDAELKVALKEKTRAVRKQVGKTAVRSQASAAKSTTAKKQSETKPVTPKAKASRSRKAPAKAAKASAKRAR